MFAVLKDTDLDFMEITGWISEHMFNPELVDTNYFSPEEEDEAEEERKRLQEEGGGEDRDEDEWARDVIPNPEEEPPKKDEKKDKNLDDMARELNLPWHSQIVSETVYKGLDFELLWSHFRNKLLHYKQLETIYANLPAAEQAKEHAFRVNLNRVSRATSKSKYDRPSANVRHA